MTPVRKGAVAVLIVFLLSRALCFLAGVRFDPTPLPFYWQYIEPDLLREDLLRSLAHLHGQPPLFNLFLGVVLKVFPGREELAFSGAFRVLGLLVTLGGYALMIRLGASTRAATLAAGMFAISPANILYENWLFYPIPVAFLLVAAALCLHRFLLHRAALDALFFFLVTACVSLTWSFFHLLWLLASLVLLVGVLRSARRKLVLAALAPLLLACLWYGKNLVMHGQFSASAWMGMNFARIATIQIPKPERQALVDSGELTPLAMIHPFSPLRAYEELIEKPPHTGLPLLDRERKKSGADNLHHLAYIEISRGYARDALSLVTRHPSAYARGIRNSFLLFFRPSDDYDQVAENRRRLGGWPRLYDFVVLGQILNQPPNFDLDTHESSGYLARMVFSLGLLWMVAYSMSIRWAWRIWRRSGRGSRRALADRITLGWMGGNLVYVFLVGNLTEFGENQRFRFVVDPFVWVFLAVHVSSWLSPSRIQSKG
ncbi:MAG: hypothetical protein GHCLOJNM_03448 [bacterium]|nr:hypothetical protein [bacterium]